jgi:hypothetical protein
MSHNIRRGRIFELGPDGYGYILDEQDPRCSYAFHTTQLTAPRSASDAARNGMGRLEGQQEGRRVTFQISAEGQIEQAWLEAASDSEAA